MSTRSSRAIVIPWINGKTYLGRRNGQETKRAEPEDRSELGAEIGLEPRDGSQDTKMGPKTGTPGPTKPHDRGEAARHMYSVSRKTANAADKNRRKGRRQYETKKSSETSQKTSGTRRGGKTTIGDKTSARQMTTRRAAKDITLYGRQYERGQKTPDLSQESRGYKKRGAIHGDRNDGRHRGANKEGQQGGVPNQKAGSEVERPETPRAVTTEEAEGKNFDGRGGIEAAVRTKNGEKEPQGTIRQGCSSNSAVIGQQNGHGSEGERAANAPSREISERVYKRE